MKKILSLMLIVSVVTFVFCSCGKAENYSDEDYSKVMETAQATVAVSSNNGTVSLTEDVVRTLLGAFDKKTLSLTEDLSAYTLKLSADKINGTDGCKVEAYKENEKSPEQTYGIIGSDCYIYNTESQKYFLITEKGAFEVVSSSVNENGISYDKENSDAIMTMFKSFSKEKLGLEKELSQYIFVTTTETATDENGETIYIIDVYENDGSDAGIKLGFNENNKYVYNSDTDDYDILK